MKETAQPFEELYIPRKDFSHSSGMMYRVYKDQKNFQVVEAMSALDALAQSNVKQAYKIVRHNPMDNNVLQLNQVLNIENMNVSETLSTNDSEKIAEASASVEQKIPEPASEAVSAPAPEPSAGQGALNNDEIDKLLNG